MAFLIFMLSILGGGCDRNPRFTATLTHPFRGGIGVSRLLMNEILRLEDVRDQVLHGRPPTVDLSKRLNEFFQFSNWNRSLSDATPLQDCFFYDMFISPAGAAEADYRLFTECFPKIVGNLVAGHATLTLHVKSSSPDFFEELDVINTVLAPSSLRYVLLSESRGPTGGHHRPELGNL